MQSSLLAEVRAQLAAQRRRIRLGFGYGNAAAAVYPKVKSWPLADRNRFCNELWKSGTDEEGNLAIYLYRHFRKQCASCEFHLFEKWIDRYVNNWGHCDGVAHYLISASIENEPELASLLPPWTASANRWKRRAAAVSLVHAARRGAHTALILEIAERNTIFQGTIASTVSDVVWASGGEPKRLRGNVCTMNTFDVMGVPPLIGRTPAEAECRPEQSRTAEERQTHMGEVAGHEQVGEGEKGRAEQSEGEPSIGEKMHSFGEAIHSMSPACR